MSQPYYPNAQGQVVTNQPQVNFGTGAQVSYGLPQAGYIPPNPGYNPQQVGYNPQQVGYNPQQAGFIPPQAGYGGVPPQVVLMERPPAIPGIPPGLEYLTKIDQLLIHQQIELYELATGIETPNKYFIKNTLGQQVYFAGEESNGWNRVQMGPSRGFIMHILDNFGVEAMRASREFKCCSGCGCCACIEGCVMELTVEAPAGRVIGYARQKYGCLTPRYDILDANRSTMFQIEGPKCFCQDICCTADLDFKISTLNGSQIGKISRQWKGYGRAPTDNADNFSLSFPMDLNVQMKAVLLGTTFLIDFIHFEQRPNKNDRR